MRKELAALLHTCLSILARGNPRLPTCWSMCPDSSPRISPEGPIPPSDAASRFGTSGHRGSRSATAFNENHILAITQAICEYRAAAGRRRAAVPGEGHARASRAGVRQRARGARGQRRRGDDRLRPRLHADSRALARDPALQPRRRRGWPTASSSRRRTIRRRMAGSSTIRPTAARPTRAPRTGFRTAPTSCSAPGLAGVRRVPYRARAGARTHAPVTITFRRT